LKWDEHELDPKPKAKDLSVGGLFACVMPTKKISVFGVKFPYIVSGFQIRKVLATNFRFASYPKGAAVDKSKRKDTPITILNVGNAAGFVPGDQIILDNNVANVTSVTGNKITIDAAIPFPHAKNPIVRLVVQGAIDQVYDLSDPTDTIHVDDVRDFFIGMKVKIGRVGNFETCIIENIEEDFTPTDPSAKLPGSISVDIYLTKPKKVGDVVRDCLQPNELITSYTLTSKESWSEDQVTRDNISKVLKKSVRVDSRAKGLSYFVGDLGLDEVEISAEITFRPQIPLQEQRPARPDANCGAPFQCLCVGCDEEAFDEGIAALEALAKKKMGGAGSSSKKK